MHSLVLSKEVGCYPVAPYLAVRHSAAGATGVAVLVGAWV